MKYRKLPVEIQAHPWFKNGDHPLDGDPKTAGDVVRYYRHPSVNGTSVCAACEHTFHDHGWIDTLEGGHTVCVGGWIITGVKGKHYPRKPDIFKMSYEEVPIN